MISASTSPDNGINAQSNKDGTGLRQSRLIVGGKRGVPRGKVTGDEFVEFKLAHLNAFS